MKIIAILLWLLCACHSFASESLEVPIGFEKQELDDTYGQILRPVGWYYNSFTTEQGIVWTIAKEDLSKKSYETGMRIQLIPGIKKISGKSAEKFAKEFIAGKISSVKVQKICEEKYNEGFRVICLETIEPSARLGINYRILYSISWSDERDWFVITTFGAPENDWESLKSTMDVMSKFILVGPKFYEKNGSNN